MVEFDNTKKRVKILWICISTEDIKQDLGEWLCTSPQGGEEAVRSYIIRHSENIGPQLEFLSVELYLARKLQADVLFRKGTKYYITEIKHGRPGEKKVRDKVLMYHKMLAKTLREKNVDFKEIIPVVVWSEDTPPFCRRYAIGLSKRIRHLKPTIRE